MNEVKLDYLDGINDIIELFQKEPWLFDSNEYRCYEACKKEIRALEKQHKGVYEKYHDYIEYITERLSI